MKWRGISVDSAEQAQAPRSLRDRLLEVRAGIAQYVRPENQQINERTIEWLRTGGFADRALKAGDIAPSFELADQNSRSVKSADLLAQGPLIVSFFRGRWCPFCVAQLEAWRDALPLVKASGASLVAISAQKVQHNAFTAAQHRLSFPLLSDLGNSIAKQFGVVYRMPDEQEQLYRRSFVNLPHLNGDESWELPLAATFVVAQDGRIKAAFVDCDYRERPDPEDVLKTV
jgi:peroxiredoxin